MSILAFNRDIRYLLGSVFVSTLSSWFLVIALPIVFYNLTNSYSATTILVIAKFIPALFANTLIIKLQAWRVDAVVIMRYAEILKASIAIFFLFTTNELHFLVMTFLMYFGDMLYEPCTYSSVRFYVEENECSTINNSMAVIQTSVMLLGALFGALVLEVLGFHVLMIASSILFLSSFFLALRMRKAQKFTDKKVNMKKRLESVARLMEHRAVFAFLLIDVVTGLSLGALNSLMPIVVQMHFNNSAIFLSSFFIAQTIGMLLGNGLFQILLAKRKQNKIYIASTLFTILVFMLFGFPSSLIIIAIILLLVGAGNAIQDVSLTTTIQLLPIKDNTVTTIFALRGTLIAVVIILTTFIVNTLLDLLIIGHITLFLGSLSVVAVLIILFILKMFALKKH